MEINEDVEWLNVAKNTIIEAWYREIVHQNETDGPPATFCLSLCLEILGLIRGPPRTQFHFAKNTVYGLGIRDIKVPSDSKHV